MNTTRLLVALLAVCSISIASQLLRACPFCSATSQTLSEELASMDVSVIAKLIALPPGVGTEGDVPAELDLDDPDSGTAEFEVVQILRGDKAPAVGSKFRAVYFGGEESKKQFLVNGLIGERIDWTTPLPLTERGVEYVNTLGTLPEKGPERLTFFLSHLEDEDPLLAQDAYDEFARAPYDEVIAIGDQMDRQQLVAWIEDANVGPTRRRLYLTMLGICGQPEDIEILESLLKYNYDQLKPGLALSLTTLNQNGPVLASPVLAEMVKSDVRRKQQCLDALIAAYLKLKGPAGLPLIEELFLKNPGAEYTHVYATIMALRFHGEETDVLPRERLLESVRLLLDNEEIADQVIPDLARWEDWSVLDRLVRMFRDSDENSWVRQPVISYLLAASDQEGEVGQRATSAIDELEELDPQGVKRARSYMSFGLLAKTAGKKDATEPDNEQESVTASDAEPPQVEEDAELASPGAGSEIAATEQGTDTQSVASAAEKPAAEAAPVAASSVFDAPSRVLIIGVPLIAGVVLFGIFALLLRGADVRSSGGGS